MTRVCSQQLFRVVNVFEFGFVISSLPTLIPDADREHALQIYNILDGTFGGVP
jgi:hypothetical protein